MKQKVVIRAIVSQRDRILLLRRCSSRKSICGLYELPGGALHPGEQPIDSLKRSLQIHAGIYPEVVRLKDVVSFVDPDIGSIQYLFILYEVSLSNLSVKVSLDDEYDHYDWQSLSNIHQNQITSSTALLLDFGSDIVSSRYHTDADNKNDYKNTTFLIYSDGGSRGNPGPSASAFLIMDHKDNVIAQGGKFLGYNNSGMAEYAAVELALEKAAALNIRKIEFRSDSLMVVNQLNGLFSVKNQEYRSVHDRILRLSSQFNSINFRHVHREYNRLADGLVNKILDDNQKI